MIGFGLGVLTGLFLFWCAERWRSWKGDDDFKPLHGKSDRHPSKRR